MQKNTISSSERPDLPANSKIWFFSLLKLLSGIYLILTAFYCLLAYLPYTYYALVRAPAYAWMPVFTRHHALFYWLCVPWTVWESLPKNRMRYIVFSIVSLLGVFLALHPFLPGIQSDGSAYAGCLVALALLAFLAAISLGRKFFGEAGAPGSLQQLPVAGAVLLALIVATDYFTASHLRTFLETKSWSLHTPDAELLAWSALSHVAVALIAVALLNLIRLAASKSPQPRLVRFTLYGALAVACLWFAAARFLSTALSFDGWRAQLFAAALAISLTLWGFWVSLPILARPEKFTSSNRLAKLIPATIAAALAVSALLLPALLTEGDWNGFLQGTFTLAFW